MLKGIDEMLDSPYRCFVRPLSMEYHLEIVASLN